MNRPVAVHPDIAQTDLQPGIDLLENAGFEVRVAASGEQDVIAHLAADADALLIGYSQIDRELIERLGNLGINATQSGGFDMVDIAAATERDTWVANVPVAATEAVATHAMAMTLSLLRGLAFSDRRSVQAGLWDRTSEALRGVSEVAVGVLGLGRIGSRLAVLLDPVVGRVVGFDPFLTESDGRERLGFDELNEISDVVSLHLSLTADTALVLDAPRFARMRKGAFVVNVSRGVLIDPEAFLDLFDTDHLSGAARDVLPEEPPQHGAGIVGHLRDLLTPHAAYLSDRTVKDYVLHQAQNVACGISKAPRTSQSMRRKARRLRPELPLTH